MSLRTKNDTVVRARELRRAMSLPEALLWQVLRSRPSGLKFRRQHPFGPYVLDFYCAKAKVVVEVDGASHDMGDRPERDRQRDAWLIAQGLKVLRFTAEDAMKDLDSVVRAIIIGCSPQ